MIRIIDKSEMSRYINYEDRICCICKSNETYIDPHGKRQWHSCICGKESCTKFLCEDCFHKYDERSQHYIVRGLAKSRLGQLTLYDSHGKGIIGAQTVANTLGIDDFSITIDNFCYYVDLSNNNPLYGYVEVKTMSLNVLHKQWGSGKIKHKNFDTLFLVCVDQYEPWRNILEIYAIPKKVVGNRKTITIRKDLSKTAWYLRYRIDEKPYNEIFHSLMEFLKDKKYFGINDIKRWLEIRKNKV